MWVSRRACMMMHSAAERRRRRPGSYILPGPRRLAMVAEASTISTPRRRACHRARSSHHAAAYFHEVLGVNAQAAGASPTRRYRSPTSSAARHARRRSPRRRFADISAWLKQKCNARDWRDASRHVPPCLFRIIATLMTPSHWLTLFSNFEENHRSCSSSFTIFIHSPSSHLLHVHSFMYVHSRSVHSCSCSIDIDIDIFIFHAIFIFICNVTPCRHSMQKRSRHARKTPPCRRSCRLMYAAASCRHRQNAHHHTTPPYCNASSPCLLSPTPTHRHCTAVHSSPVHRPHRRPAHHARPARSRRFAWLHEGKAAASRRHAALMGNDGQQWMTRLPRRE